jgi:hypothetical protein
VMDPAIQCVADSIRMWGGYDCTSNEVTWYNIDCSRYPVTI